MNTTLFCSQSLNPKLIKCGFPSDKIRKIKENKKTIKYIKLGYAWEFMFIKGVFISISPRTILHGEKYHKINCTDMKTMQSILREQDRVYFKNYEFSMNNALQYAADYLTDNSKTDKIILCKHPIQDRIVSYDTANRLKNIGYPQTPSAFVYTPFGCLSPYFSAKEAYGEDIACAPNLFEALMWLYNVKKTFVSMEYKKFPINDRKYFPWIIHYMKSDKIITGETSYGKKWASWADSLENAINNATISLKQ